jgi:GWxTD domain-containing protein
MRARFSIAVLFLAAFAANSFAALSKEYADFSKGPLQHLLTKDERKQWESIQTDEQAKVFIDLFWARRDPSPTTAHNEFREAVEARIKHADERFFEQKLVGSVTDRGKVFILLGSPTKMRRSATPGTGTIQTPGGAFRADDSITSVQQYSPKELWEYEQGKITAIKFGQPVVEVAFIDQYGTNEWKMERVLRTDYGNVFEKVARGYITQPNLTELPVYAATASTVRAAAVAPMAVTTNAAATAFKSDALREAVEQARAAKAASNALFINYGEYVTSDGEHFVPVQLYVPKSAGVPADAKLTFFGAVDSESGERVMVIEEPVALSVSKDDLFYAKSLKLPAGRYVGTFGLAREGKPVAVVTQPMVLQGVDKDAPGASPLLLTNNIYPLAEAQMPTDPFAFGGMKVVPKGDRIFRRSEDLGYFFELRHPGIDATSKAPNLSMKISLTGTTAEGKPVKILGPSQSVPAQELNGVPGHWAVGQAMPLQTIKPGSYTIAVKVTDVALGKTYDLQESFRVVE